MYPFSIFYFIWNRIDIWHVLLHYALLAQCINTEGHPITKSNADFFSKW